MSSSSSSSSRSSSSSSSSSVVLMIIALCRGSCSNLEASKRRTEKLRSRHVAARLVGRKDACV